MLAIFVVVGARHLRQQMSRTRPKGEVDASAQMS
jgi:hypothetical protein